uniref:DUF4139 domain-containing protein n=1 Tax=Psilocybe cubensis TaxID=181762 RepID=A0A8H8CPA6_PSICU
MSQHDKGTNTISLVASENSKISNINLYSGRAEITRLFKFDIKAGQNKVTILGLPWSLQDNSLRVEGRGNASIHDVVVAKTLPPPRKSSNTIDNTQARNPLKRRKKELESELDSTRHARTALDKSLDTVGEGGFEASQLEGTLDTYFRLGRKVALRILDIEKELLEVEELIKQEEKQRKAAPFIPSWQVSIDVHGKFDENVRVYLKYAVRNADWTAAYDIRVYTQAKEKAVAIVYKAVITQDTGESWDDASLTLETAQPSFGIQLPTLSPWRVMPRQTTIEYPSGHVRERRRSPSPRGRAQSRSRSPRRHRRVSPSRDSTLSFPYSSGNYDREPELVHRTVSVSDKGGISAVFRVPGVINVPSDGGKHNVTIAHFDVNAELMWFAIPAVDTRAHIKARIRNESDYPFIPGLANIYVDGSFVATTYIPSISPQEVFECPLGLDPSIRLTYHPREKKSAQSGFYSKTSTQSFTQRISVFNKRSAPVTNLKLIDRIPVSEDERIEVKLISPQLTPVPAAKAGGKAAAAASQSTATSKAPGSPSSIPAWLRPIRVSEGVMAQWDGIDDPTGGAGLSAVGKTGKFNWLLSVPAQTTISLVLHFEVNYPEALAVQGI